MLSANIERQIRRENDKAKREGDKRDRWFSVDLRNEIIVTGVEGGSFTREYGPRQWMHVHIRIPKMLWPLVLFQWKRKRSGVVQC